MRGRRAIWKFSLGFWSKLPQQRWWDYDDDFLKTKRPFKDKRIVYVLGPPGGLYETSYSLQQKNNCHMTERTHVPRRSCFRSTNQEYDSAMAIHIDSVEYNLISFTSWDGRGTLWICLNKHGSILKQRILLRSDTRTNIGLSIKSISLLNTTQIKRAYCWSVIPEYLDYLNH